MHLMTLLKQSFILMAMISVLWFFLGAGQPHLFLQLSYGIHGLVGLFHDFYYGLVEFVLTAVEYLEKTELLLSLVGSGFDQLNIVLRVMQMLRVHFDGLLYFLEFLQCVL